MLLDFYKLREQPFGVTPDARYLYPSATHREALASLLYGVGAGRGFLALIAKPGMGKTTLLFESLEQLRETDRTVFLLQTVSTPSDFLRALLEELGVGTKDESLVELQSKLNELLVEQHRSGKRLLVVIDEAQNLNDSVLELVRQLSNFETAREKLLQIILSGQPQLAQRIALPELLQLRQRVSMFACLKPFSPEETGLYIDHRMRIAGYSSEAPLFTAKALALIAQSSEGIPRNINNLCFNALSLGYALQRKTIDCDIVREVLADLDLEPWRKRSSPSDRPVERDSEGTLGFVSAASAPTTPAGLLPKLAFGAAILLVLAGALYGSHRWASSTEGVRANSAGPALAPATAPVMSADHRQQSGTPAGSTVHADGVVPALPAAAATSLSDPDQGQQAVGPVSTIRVGPRRTLFGICVDQYGRCSSELLQEIHKLNPQLADLDHIEPGEKLRLPISGAMQGNPTQSTKERHREALLAERGTR